MKNRPKFMKHVFFLEVINAGVRTVENKGAGNRGVIKFIFWRSGTDHPILDRWISGGRNGL